MSKYSRWRDDLGRREYWGETVDRYLNFWDDRFSGLLLDSERDKLRATLVGLGAVPSMRCLMTAGKALATDEISGYNCSYLTISRVAAWPEAMYLLMCGVGVGYSVETKHVTQLPVVPDTLVSGDEVIVVEDSKYGWAGAFRRLLDSLYDGKLPRWSTAKVRPSGAVLKTFGGRASGPAPLEALFRHTVEVFTKARGRQLSRTECHSICCKIGDIVVVGGVRRSAMIALFSEEDQEMRNLKMGSWFEINPHYGMANNSAVYYDRPLPAQLFGDFQTLIQSQAGEPGFFNRTSAREQASRWGKRPYDVDYGCNPCGEILLRDRQTCNLSEVIARGRDTHQQILDKIWVATVFGTLQSTLTDFKFLSPKWKKNCEEERLLGVSIAGVPDHALLNGQRGEKRLKAFLEEAREHVWSVNAELAERLGVPASAAATCLKPSGNTSQLTAAASPLKPHHAKRYVRRTRGSKNDPVSKLLVEQGVPHEEEAWHPDTTWVFEWPQKAPSGSATRHDWTALDQLKLWLMYRDNWCDHNPSVTVNVREAEWPDVFAWVCNHWDKMTGITFLPDDDHNYVQAPYEEVDDEAWSALADQMPAKIDWVDLSLYESEDLTTSARELACSAGACEVV